MKRTEIKRVIWAVDPFEEDADLRKSMVSVLEQFASDADTEVVPVYVWGATPLEGFDHPRGNDVKKMKADAQSAVDRWLLPTGLKCAPLRVLMKPYLSLGEGAAVLLRFAKKISAELIVLSTHERSGLKRWFTGSFAEELSLGSDIPLLITHPKWRSARNRRSVLFATDFSKESLAALRVLVNRAKMKVWDITIFHHVEQPIYPLDDFAITGWEGFEGLYRDQKKNAGIHAHKLAEVIEKKGIRCEVIIDTSRIGSAVESILKRVKRKYLFVAVASYSGLLSRVFIGSTALELVRKSPIPVWVIHPGNQSFRRLPPARPNSRSDSSRGPERVR